MVPDFFIVGAAKSGTTSLYEALCGHDSIYNVSLKEPHFFSRPSKTLPHSGPFDHELGSSRYRNLDLKKYTELYLGKGDKLAADASADYLYFSQAAFEIFNSVGDVPIIIILRNPIDRAISAYRNMCQMGYETLPFAEALAAEAERITANFDFMWHYKSVGLYAPQVHTYLETFSRVKILLYEELVSDQKAKLAEVVSFLDLPPQELVLPASNVTVNVRFKFFARLARSEKIRWMAKYMPAQIRALLASLKRFNRSNTTLEYVMPSHLIEEFRISNKELSLLLGRDLEIWEGNHAE